MDQNCNECNVTNPACGSKCSWIIIIIAIVFLFCFCGKGNKKDECCQTDIF